MAATKTKEVNAEVAEMNVPVKDPFDCPPEERVPVILPRIPGSKDQSQYVCVNGHDFLIQRGVTVYVPPYVKEVLDHAEMAAMDAARYIEATEKV